MNTIIQVHGLTKNYAASQTLAIFPIPLPTCSPTDRKNNP